jgi:hypothetical protein
MPRDPPAGRRRSLGVLRRLAGLCLICLILPAPPAEANGRRARGPWPLVSLAALGTVTWRCDPSRHSGLALGFRTSAMGQSGWLRLRIGHRTVWQRAVRPGQVVALPYLDARTQQIEIAEGGEDGTLRAFVSVDFTPHAGYSYCWSYMPPAATVRLLARRQ